MRLPALGGAVSAARVILGSVVEKDPARRCFNSL
jgi:hypothetical protein